ncbi:MAG: ATP-binding cassette domain-containing protein [Gordonibacter sp.]|nr:ATP-binding cassette domain-containing protein [Gordonibacter sp.]
MLNNINTSKLTTENLLQENTNPVMVDVSHVSMVFNMASEQLNSLKEYVIAIARRELMFKEFRALNDISFQVHKGDVFGIMGTNGSGKSTMLKIVAGVLEPTEGKCSISGNIAPLIELGAGFDMELTARENIYLNGSLLGYSHKFIKQNFDEIVAFAEIDEFLDMPMKNYSSGMIARIAFAIATVIVPDILIVDEVLSVGDFMFQQKCERRITQLIKEHDVTVLIVSHNNDQIERLCNKVIWIEKGHARMIGTAEEVCRAYRVLGGHVGTKESEELVFSMMNNVVDCPDTISDIISAESRYGTAAKLAARCEFQTGGTVILAPGENAEHCIAATGLSGIIDAPVLLCKQAIIPDVTAQELKRLDPKNIFVIDQSEASFTQIATLIQEVTDRCESVISLCSDSAAGIAKEIYRVGTKHGNWSRTAIISYPGCTGDLISFFPYLFSQKVPVFFNLGDGTIDNDTAAIIMSGAFDRLLVLGGYIEIPDSFLESCNKNGVATERICGTSPYHANELINDHMTSTDHTDVISIERLIVLSAINPSDAFAAGAYAGKTHSAFLLEDPQNLDSVAHALTYIQKEQGQIDHLTFLGDAIRFNEMDRNILCKAVLLAKNGADCSEEK